MNKKTVDARGQLCPKPLIMTKKAIKNFTGEIEILLDNQTAMENVTRFLEDNKISFSASEKEGLHYIVVHSDGDVTKISNPEDYCVLPVNHPAAPKNAGHVICFTNDKMGQGSDELGEILIQAFCNTIKEIEPGPSALVFYNSGVFLAKEGSPVLESLKSLENSGVKILVCGTCSDYFAIKDKIGVGIISNMYDIMECLTGAGHIINP
ncbi:MAG: sulfurtransferase-like selenium metabolism protein YedF [Spirochaetales bacterium]|nr:sulfurtransferase-like selenium metabolism protein YedF [Spirochaetales bacterium]